MDLFDDENHDVFAAVKSQFADLEYFLSHNKSPNYNFLHDQVVSYGELISTSILSHYMDYRGINTMAGCKTLLKQIRITEMQR
jgi:aspartate kinase